jgi:hypothetical protein
MTALVNAVQNQAQISLLDPINKTATYQTANGVDISDYEGQIAVTTHVGVVAGTGTLIVTVETSDSSTFATGNVTVATFATITATSNHQRVFIDTNACKRYLRVVGTISGITGAVVGHLLTGVKQVQ